MNQEQLEMRLEYQTLQVEEKANFCAMVLNNLCDEGSTITNSDSDIVLSGIGEKLDMVIDTLIEAKKEVDLIEAIWNWISAENE